MPDQRCLTHGARRWPLYSLVLSIASLPAIAQADLTAVPNRPTVSTTAQPVQPGVLETEWGVDAANSHQDINALLKLGVSSNFELRFANNPLTADSGEHGLGDTSLGFKYRFSQDEGMVPSLAFIYMSKAPTAADHLGSGEIDHSFAVLASKDLGKHHLDFNCIANLLGKSSGGFIHNYLNAFAWSHPVRGKWSATAELSGTTSLDRATPGSAQFIASAIYAMRPRLVFDCGMMGRITGDIPHAMFIVGVTYSIVKFYHRNPQPAAASRQR